MGEEIELHDFVRNALVQIALGVSEANAEMHEEHGGEYSSAPYRLHSNLGDKAASVPGISFDVAVTASTGTSDEAGAKISVAVLKIGGSIEASSADSYFHRIQFVVGLHTDWD